VKSAKRNFFNQNLLFSMSYFVSCRLAFTAVACFLLSIQTSAQGVRIGEVSGNPDASSILHLESSSKGFLPPRMTSAERDAIVSPAPGLRIFNTTTNCENYYNGLAWYQLCGECIPGTPAQPSAISGPAAPCLGDAGVAYSVADVPGTSYAWSFPSGWVQVSGGTGSAVTVNVGAGSGAVSVVPSNGCGTGSSRSLSASVQTIPTAPVAGTHGQGGEQIMWNWSAVAGAAGYKYSLANDYAGATDLGNVNTYTQTGLDCGGTAYTIYVWAYNDCGVSPATQLNAVTGTCPSPTKIIFVEEVAPLQPSMYGGLAGADVICQNAAGAAGLPGVYRALLSTSTVDARDRINDGIFIRTDNQVIANNKAELFDGSVPIQVNKNEHGLTLGDTNMHVYTGSTLSGTYMGANTTCGDWTDYSQSGRYGKPTETNQDWISRNTWGCNTNTSSSGLYCVQL
jgi:hypothetical protein